MYFYKVKSNLRRNNYLAVLFLISLIYMGCVRSAHEEEEYNLISSNYNYRQGLRYCFVDSIFSSNNHFIKEDIFIDNDTLPMFSFKHTEKRINKTVMYVNTVISDFDNNTFDTIYTPFLTLNKDTCFLYYHDLNKYPPSVPTGSTDYIFINKYLEKYDLYAMLQEPVGTSTHRMVYFYDKGLNIYKVIHETTGKNKDRVDTVFFEFVKNNLKGIKTETQNYLREKSYPYIIALLKNINCVSKKKEEYSNLVGIYIKY